MEEPEEHYPERLGDALKPIEGQRTEGTDEPPAPEGAPLVVVGTIEIWDGDPIQLWGPANAEPDPKAKERK